VPFRLLSCAGADDRMRTRSTRCGSRSHPRGARTSGAQKQIPGGRRFNRILRLQSSSARRSCKLSARNRPVQGRQGCQNRVLKFASVCRPGTADLVGGALGGAGGCSTPCTSCGRCDFGFGTSGKFEPASCGWQKIRRDRKSSHPSRGGVAAEENSEWKIAIRRRNNRSFEFARGTGTVLLPLPGEWLTTPAQAAGRRY
jgi:hypothetical protein